jgi:hypothetical protein
MGAYFGEQSMISSESYSKMVSKGIDIELYASFSAIASTNPLFDYNKTESDTFKLYTQEQLIYSQGVHPPKNGIPLTWRQTTMEAPSILSITLKSVSTLPVITMTYPEASEILNNCSKEYCQKLLSDGKITSCDLPNPDPPLPTTTTTSTTNTSPLPTKTTDTSPSTSDSMWTLISCEPIGVRAATAAKDAKDLSLPSFGSHLNPISPRGGQIMPTL